MEISHASVRAHLRNVVLVVGGLITPLMSAMSDRAHAAVSGMVVGWSRAMSAVRIFSTSVKLANQLLSLLTLIAAAPAVISATLSVQPQAGEPASTHCCPGNL